MKSDDSLAKSILNSLSAHVAIIDQEGVILETNEAWKKFAVSNNITMQPDTIGVNYFDMCDFNIGDPAKCAGQVSAGINSLINGSIDEFVIEYPCHSPDEERWFYMKATRLAGPGSIRIVVSHENITKLKNAVSALDEREKDLERERRGLIEMNTAMKVLLKRREEDRDELGENVVSNIKELVLPYVEKIKSTGLIPRQKMFIDIIESSLQDIVSPFLKNLSSQFFSLTSREIEVAYLIREGRTTKEISGILSISASTVNFHRKSIRKKFKISKRQTNLRSHLLSMDI